MDELLRLNKLSTAKSGVFRVEPLLGCVEYQLHDRRLQLDFLAGRAAAIAGAAVQLRFQVPRRSFRAHAKHTTGICLDFTVLG
jgi:hypothetical protein